MGRGGSPSGPARPAPSPERALLDLVGLAARAGALVHGTDATRRAVREGSVLLVLVAGDAAAGQMGKLLPLLEARGVSVWFSEKDIALGTSLLREIDKGLARSRVGIVLVTPALLRRLTQEGIADKELSALLARELLVPIVHGTT